MKHILTYFILCVSLVVTVYCQCHYGYGYSDGPSTWCKICSNTQCCGNQQSPINIPSSGSSVQYKDFAAFYMKNYHTEYSLKVYNNGHTIGVSINDQTNILPYITGGPLQSKYIFEGVHFHWPSEHEYGNSQFAGEIHFVHYLASAGSFDKAVTMKNGIAVVAVLLQKSYNNVDNDFVDFISSFRGSVRYQDQSYVSSPNELSILLPPNIDESTGYFTYQGSLTTPNCNQVVTWIILNPTLYIPSSVLSQLQSYLMSTPHGSTKPVNLLPNNRPVQALNGRTIYRTF